MCVSRPIYDAGQAPVANTGRRSAAFTLVELMVVIVIIGILASLTLTGLAGVRQRAKIEKTKSTIRKIDAVIRPMYESYLTRRIFVDRSIFGAAILTGRDLAAERLRLLRVTMMNEMPDTWTEANAATLAEPTPPALAGTTTIRGYRPSATARRYRTRYIQVSSSPNLDKHQSAETLYMVVAMGGVYPDALESFRADEIGDIDGDTALEFLDGWGKPIHFRRWPIGFALVTGTPPAPDPFDPLRITAAAVPPNGDPETYPLIYSGGPDNALEGRLDEDAYGISEPDPSDPDFVDWPLLLRAPINLVLPAVPPPGPRYQALAWPFAGKVLTYKKSGGQEAARDNITNYDLLRK